MADFKYFTRGSSSPQGKPRVYFTAHPDDYDRYFEEIRKELLDRQNCAIFYLDADTKSEEVEDYELRLGEMQLFVIPVTAKLMTQPNRAMDAEVPFAFERHIPVLPLMQESGLEELFNSRFGDLQYLDKNNTDPTAIPYAEKLTNYLESVIVGDELARQVRDAFDAYIFLSYRKKDRKYAQELMKLIHAHPFCRDIAIWYDEFLTPGEDFNDAIKAALAKSGLFALTVTPNLVNENNYIVEHEYPMAKELEMDILPAEMVPTDRDRLSEMYQDIPEPVGADNLEALKERLLPLAKKLAITENDFDPKHNFFIGLAYLSGIDVEVDHARAVELITGSAEAGCIPATEKLVSMYENGEGVGRDYYQAVAWREKLVEQREKEYEANPNEDTALELLIALWNLGDAYRALGQLVPAQRAYEEMRRYSEAFAEEYQGLKRYPSISYDNLGEIAKSRGKLAEAEDFFRKSFVIREVLADDSNTVLARNDLSISYDNLGEIVRMQGRLAEAEDFYRKGLAIREALADESDTGKDRRGLALSYNYLGDIAKAQDKLAEAEDYYRKGLAIREALANETGTEKARRDLLISYYQLGELAKTQKKYDEAEKWYRKALSIAKALEDENSTIDAKRDLSIIYRSFGDIAKENNQLDESKEFYLKSLEINESLAKETGTVQARRDLTNTYSSLGLVSQMQGKFEEAEEWDQKALEIVEELIDETDAPVVLIELVMVYFNISFSSNNMRFYKKGLAILKKLCVKYPELKELPELYQEMKKKKLLIGAVFTLSKITGKKKKK